LRANVLIALDGNGNYYGGNATSSSYYYCGQLKCLFLQTTTVVSHATTAAAVAAGRGAGEDGVGDAVSSSSSAAEDGEAADAATESLADGNGMSRPSNPALAKPPSSALPLAFPTASPALPQLLNARNVPLGGDTIDALAARPLSLSRRFSIDSVVAIIGSGEGAIVVL
jgi:hypothetical protein